MAELAGRTRTRFRIPRVEFDLSGLLLGMLGYLAYRWSWGLLAGWLGIAGRFTETIPALKGPGIPAGLIVPTEGGVTLEAGAVLKAEVMAGIAQGLSLPSLPNVLSQLGWPQLPITIEDKTLMLRELPSLTLAWWEWGVVGLWFLVLWSVVGGALARVHAYRIARDESVGALDALVFSFENLKGFLMAPFFVVAAAAFFVALNLLAGLVISIPWAGPILQIVLHPLALLGGVVITVITVGGVFGLPVMHSALVTERNGTLDAISRTYSYVFTRPLLYIGGVVVVFAVGAVLLQFGSWFLGVTTKTLVLGASHFGVAQGDSAAGVLIAGSRAGLNMLFVEQAPPDLPTHLKLGLWVSWAFAFLGAALVRGAVLSYVVGGLTDVYFMLRGEVDGIPESEIYVEGETASLGEPLDDEPGASSD